MMADCVVAEEMNVHQNSLEPSVDQDVDQAPSELKLSEPLEDASPDKAISIPDRQDSEECDVSAQSESPVQNDDAAEESQSPSASPVSEEQVQLDISDNDQVPQSPGPDQVLEEPELSEPEPEISEPEPEPQDSEPELEVSEPEPEVSEPEPEVSEPQPEPQPESQIPEPEPQLEPELVPEPALLLESSAPVASDKSVKIKELENKISELETTLKSKDAKIDELQTEVAKLNETIMSKSVPTAKKPPGGSEPRSKTVGAKKTTRPVSAAKAVSKASPTSNGIPKKTPGSSPGKRPTSASSRPKTAPPAKPAASKTPSVGKKAGKTGGNRVEMTKGADGEEHAVKLFLRGRGIVCYPPTDFTLENVVSEKPDEALKINWVYGYRGRDSQDNIFCLPSGEVLYYQAAVGVIYNPAAKSQRFYQGHNDDIKCIALNPKEPNIVATGQTAGHDEKEGDPHVRVWNCETLETLAVLGLGNLQRGVGSVSFSPDGTKVLAVDEGNDHTIYVYDWKKNSKLASQKGHQDPVLGAEYIPGQNNKFVTYGKGHIIFWEQEGAKLSKKSGIFEKHPKPRFITALAFNDAGNPITGDNNGNLFLWNSSDRKIAKSKTGAHEGTIYSIAVKDDEIYTGGQDCKIKKFKGTDLSDLDAWQVDNAEHSRVKALCFVGEEVAIGTYNNGMLLGRFGEEPVQVVYGHGAGDLWGGANHPTDNTFATVGQDKIVYIWDAASHTPKYIFKVDKPAQSCGFSPCGSVLAVASTTGEWWVLDSTTGDLLSSYKSGPEQIDAISYSPDGTSIGVGSHDNMVYLFSCDDLRAEYKPIGRCSGHSSFITHLDFSEDGKVLQTTSGDYEHLFWDATNGDQITSTKDMRDVTMATYTCTLGFPVCGIWPVGYDGTDINALSRSNGSKLVATADDFGLVNLFRYPCCDPAAAWSSYRGHSAHVTKVRFLAGDQELFTLGGRDQSIIQWGVA